MSRLLAAGLGDVDSFGRGPCLDRPQVKINVAVGLEEGRCRASDFTACRICAKRYVQLGSRDRDTKGAPRRRHRTDFDETHVAPTCLSTSREIRTATRPSTDTWRRS
jgi:hypothetical protein